MKNRQICVTDKKRKLQVQIEQKFNPKLHLQKSLELDAVQGYPSIAWLRKNQWFLA